MNIRIIQSESFKSGRLILVNKPYTWTSFDVVNKIRWVLRKHLQTGKIKVGHAGTLDPLATGLLILCTGSFTKKISVIQQQEKEYEAIFHLGKTTDSYDLESEINTEHPTEHINEEMIHKAAAALSGKQMQLPPAFSAKAVDGKRAYELARAGKVVKLDPVAVNIYEFQITKVEMPMVHARIVCSTGTYIRSIARDLGAALDSGAYLAKLVRTRIGEHRLDQALEPSVFEEWAKQISSSSAEQ